MGLYRRVIRITGDDSPNVKWAKEQIKRGIRPTGELLVPGVLPWHVYVKRRVTWDKIRQCIGIDAQFYQGQEVLMYPPLWLNRAEEVALKLRGQIRHAKAIGCDPAEGGDKTTMAAVDTFGLIEMLSAKTPDTTVVTASLLAFMRKHNVEPGRVAIDRGGGGKEHADRLRLQGFPVRTVAFGESVSVEPQRGMVTVEVKMDRREDRYAYKNRRAQMYGELRLMLDPDNVIGFGIGAEHMTLRQELAPIPLLYDQEGRMRLLPKHKKDADSEERTLTELIGHSPDEADALVLAVHAMLHKPTRKQVKVF